MGMSMGYGKSDDKQSIKTNLPDWVIALERKLDVPVHSDFLPKYSDLVVSINESNQSLQAFSDEFTARSSTLAIIKNSCKNLPKIFERAQHEVSRLQSEIKENKIRLATILEQLAKVTSQLRLHLNDCDQYNIFNKKLTESFISVQTIREGKESLFWEDIPGFTH